MKKKRLQWSIPCSLATAMILGLVAAPASASPMMPLSLEKKVQQQERKTSYELTVEQQKQEQINRIEAAKKAIDDANEAARQAAMERAANQLKQERPDIERQRPTDRQQQQQPNRENPPRPHSVNLIPGR